MITQMNIKPWCNCHSTGKWQKQDGFSLDPPSGLWVCTRCRKPSKMNYDRLVLGLTQIPQPKQEEDIVEIEAHYAAKQEVRKELDWADDDDPDDGFDWDDND